MNQAIEKATGKLESWGDTLFEMLPNLAVAVAVLVVFYLLGRLVRRLVTRAAARLGKRQAVVRLLGGASLTVVLLLGLFIALGVLKLDRAVTSLLAGAGIAGLALGLAVQSLAASLMAGVMLSLRGRFRIGDLIRTNGEFGTVESINLRTTTLMTPQGQRVVVPNKEILERPFTNFTADGRRRVDLEVGISYGDDLERARAIALEAVEEVPGRLADREPELFYTGFGASSINFVVRIWIEFAKQADYLAARSAAIVRIKRAFDAEGITIPFPIRTLDFGAQATERLAGELLPRPAGSSGSAADGADAPAS